MGGDGKETGVPVMDAGFPPRAIQGAPDGFSWGSYDVAFYKTTSG